MLPQPRRRRQCPAVTADTLVIATDGSALGNPGPTGWCWYADPTCWAAAGAGRGTNNVAELSAVRDALVAIPATVPLEVRIDSQYTMDALTKWCHGWARNGWQTAKGTPVANADLIREVLALMRGRHVRFVKVRAHQVRGGDERNEAADARAQAAARAAQRGAPIPTGPGFTR